MTTVVHTISVEMMLAGGIFEAMTRLGSALGGIHTKVDKIHSAIGNWTGAFAVVAGSLGIGLVAKGMEDLFKQMELYQEKISKLKQLNQVDLKGVTDTVSRINAQLPGSTPSGLLQIFTEGRDIINVQDEEKKSVEMLKALPLFGEYARVMASSKHIPFDEAAEALRPLIKAADISGHLTDQKTQDYDPERLKQFLDAAFKSIQTSGGLINENTIFGLASQGGLAMREMDKQGLMEMFAFSEVMGGQRAGTALMSIFQQFSGGVMFTRVANELQRLGILGKKGKEGDKDADWYTDHGRVQLSDDASKRLGSFFQTQPLQGFKILQQAMAENGITDPKDQQREIFRILQRATSMRMAGDATSNMQQILREIEMANSAQGVHEARETQDTTSINTALQNVGAAYRSLLQVISEDKGEIVVSWINSFRVQIQSLTKVISEIDPNSMKGLTTSISGIGAFVGTMTSLGDSLDVAQSKLLQFANFLRSIFGWLPGGGNHWTTGDINTKLHGGYVPDYVPPDKSGSRFGIEPIIPYNPKSPEQPNNWFQHLFTPSSFNGPDMNIPKGSKIIVIHTALNLDGATLARAVEGQIAELHELPDSASTGNGVASPVINDWNHI